MHSNHDVTNALDQRRQDFLELARNLIAAVAREALDHNPNLSPKLKERLRDAERGRYDAKLIALLLESMSEATNPLFFADRVRGATLRSVAASVSPCVVDTYLTNTRAQSTADIAQALFITERTGVRRDQLLDTLGPEELTLHFHKAAVLNWSENGRKHFS